VVAGAAGSDICSSIQFKYTPNAWLTGYYWPGSNDGADQDDDDNTDSVDRSSSSDSAEPTSISSSTQGSPLFQNLTLI
jgi:hypothetical protein